MNLILFGAPGAGKGTQGALLAQRLRLPRISTGDLLREAVRLGTPLGLEAKRYMDAGELVPDAVMLGLVREALAAPAAAPGFILDGFPRNVPQAEALDEILQSLERSLDYVAVLDISDDQVVKRIAGRRSCPACNAVYNVYYEPPLAEGRCDNCGSALAQRADDREDTVRHRLEVYHAQTRPVLAFYERAGVPVVHVAGERAVDDVQAQLVSCLVP